MKKINILQLITGLGMGGAEKVVLDLARNISKDNFNSYVISMSKRNELLDEFKQNNIDTTVLNKSNSLFDMFSIIKILNKFIIKKDIQIIHAHMAHSIIIASILKFLNPSIKIVFTSHNLNIGSKLIEFVIYILKPFRNIDIVFSKEILKYFYKKDYKVLPNGVDIEKYKLKLEKNKKFTFIAIGRLETVKNHIFLIEVANKLKQKYDFKIEIIGEGYMRKELEQSISKHGLTDSIDLMGIRNDIPELLNKAHCLIMPSLWEGLPIVILEAGASSLPIVSTPVGSIPSLLNKKNSYLSDLDMFEDVMCDVIENYETAKEKGEQLFYEINLSCSIQNIVKEHEKIYKDLI